MKKKLIYALSFAMLIGVTSCNKLEDFGDTNNNPLATTKPNPAALLTGSLRSLPNWTADRRPGWYAQYFTETQYPGGSLYALPQIAHAGNYNGILFDLQNVENLNVNKNMTNVANVAKQFIFWQMTDRWGDLPYSEALKGQEVPSPKYDTQEVIYKGMIKALTDANASFDASAIQGDIIYGGNVASWKRAINSLRMLMSIQLSKKYPTASGYAATEFKAALADAGGYIATNAQNMKLVYAAPNFKNLMWGWYDGRGDDGESKTVTDLLTTLGDARINPFGGSSHTGGAATSNVGVPYGLSEANVRIFVSATPNWARILRGDLRVEGSPIYLVTAAQTALARAEAANLGWTTENLNSVYEQGIALSHEQWGLAAPGPSYLTHPDVVLGTDNVKKIATQQWIASYTDGHMGWNIWRKTGFPVLTPAPAATNVTKQIVRRYTYATAEYTSNNANVKAAADRIPGGDTQDSKVWWDQ